MVLTEDKITDKNTESFVDIAIEICYYHMNMNGLVSHVDST